MKVHIVEHVPFEGPGLILKWAEDRKAAIGFTRLYNDEAFPPVGSFDLLVLMGGPMSVNDEEKYLWLAKEKSFIQNAIAGNRKVIGICLGAQLIAAALGNRVFRNKEREIGWFPVTFTPEIRNTYLFDHFPDSAVVFHWHGETFDLPDGAIPLGSSEACLHQGFLYGSNVVALQFHLEETGDSLQIITKELLSELIPGKWVQSPEEIEKGIARIPLAKEMLFHLLDKLMH